MDTIKSFIFYTCFSGLFTTVRGEIGPLLKEVKWTFATTYWPSFRITRCATTEGKNCCSAIFFWLTRTPLTSHLTSSVTPDQPSRTFPRLCYFTLWICDILNAQTTTTTTTNVGCFLPCFLTASCRHRTVVDRCGSRSGKSTAGARRWAGESRLISRLERAVPRAAVVWRSEPPKVHSGVTHLHSVTQSTAWPRSFFPSSFFFFLSSSAIYSSSVCIRCAHLKCPLALIHDLCFQEAKVANKWDVLHEGPTVFTWKCRRYIQNTWVNK